MIRKPAAYRRKLLRRLADAADVVTAAADATARRTLPADLADAITAAGASLADHRRRLRGRPTADQLAAARKAVDAFGRATADALLTGFGLPPARTTRKTTTRPARAGRA